MDAPNYDEYDSLVRSAHAQCLTPFTVTFDHEPLKNGSLVAVSKLKSEPTVVIEPQLTDLHAEFSLMMIDPDAPTPDRPTNRDMSEGHHVLEYQPPAQDITGAEHRGIFLLLKQQRHIGEVNTSRDVQRGSLGPSSRAGFIAREFAAQHDLGPPVNALMFRWGGRGALEPAAA